MPPARTRIAALLVAALLALTPASLAGEPSPPVLARFVTEGGVPAAALLTTTPGAPDRYTTAGGPTVRRNEHFRAGSVTKTFVATVVLQLVAEGRLSLDEPVRARLGDPVPGHRLDDRVTVRTLLTHTSGLYDYVRVTTSPAPTSPRAALRTALTHVPRPVGSFAYSNTNYVVLGMLVERVTGHPYAVEAERRILTPLALTGTSFPGARRALPTPHRPGEPDVDPRVAGAAGELVSTLDDLTRFYSALLGGRLLPAEQMRELLDTSATGGRYGMAVFPERLSCGLTVWGHNGRITGSAVRAATTADGRRTLVFRVTTDRQADRGLQRALLESAFCP
ncbi:serine hydrolase domain-containing protein [Streptomyces sp. NPDC048629]|uniref:serine hydrolase domain-containing protein n=1 Tax=Streptomyces sp. NPDC048629 TaxID=3154824 RepID=UPI00343E553A